ncbi:MAG: hypothetical protein WD689_10145 [Gaiellaceae bacterium]
MLSHRLQLLIDPERNRRLREEARRRNTSVAEVVRDAIDAALPVDERKRRAAERILMAEPMPVPETIEELNAEIDEMFDGGL